MNRTLEGILLFAGPIIYFILGIDVLYIGPRQGGFIDIVGAIYLAMGIIAAVLILLFMLLNKLKLHIHYNWWKNLVISFVASGLAMLVFYILARSGA